MPAAHACAVLGRRACALAAICSATLHGLMVGHAGNPALVFLILVMAAACLFCAHELWTAESLRAWCIVAVMNLAMVAVHWSVPTHHHGSGANAAVLGAAPAVPASILMTAATVIALAEAAVATVVLWVSTRHRSTSAAPQPN